jgi:hypothetical protein
MKILALTVAPLLTASPVAAQQQRQQALGAGGQTNTSILPNNGLYMYWRNGCDFLQTNPPARTSRATDRAPRLRDRAPRLEPAPPPDRALGPELVPSQAVV